ncbi:MAG: antitoxin TumA [bacterium]
MAKQRIEYDSPVEALVALAKRLNVLESRHQMKSEDFFDQYTKGKLDDSIDFVEWSNDYQHFIDLKFQLEASLRRVA